MAHKYFNDKPLKEKQAHSSLVVANMMLAYKVENEKELNRVLGCNLEMLQIVFYCCFI